MALSNWAAAAWNEKGEPVLARAVFGDVIVELSKNWLDIGDEKAWRKEDGSLKPWVLVVYDGSIIYRHVDICAKWYEKQNAIFFYAYDRKSKRALLGIGAYGWETVRCKKKVKVKLEDGKVEEFCEEEESKWVCIKEETFKAFLRWLKRNEQFDYLAMPEPPEIKELVCYNQGTLYIVEKLHGTLSNEDLKKPEVRDLLGTEILSKVVWGGRKSKPNH